MGFSASTGQETTVEHVQGDVTGAGHAPQDTSEHG